MRVAQVTTDGSVRLSNAPVAYLLDPDECNNDEANYWIFNGLGLRGILDRTPRDVLDCTVGGCTVDSDPSTMDRDERAFCFVKSTTF
jgi:tRNA (mo5U34)-methyltransferase